MTTIIIIVVVALVFFVTVCVVTFMVWKREAEMRTDSIREIKDNLQRLEEDVSWLIDKFDYRGCCFCGIIHFCQPCQAFIGDGNHTHVGIDGAEGVIGCLCLAQCHRIK